MGASDNRGDETSDRFSIDSRLISILSVFAFSGILLVLITILAANTLTALQSYSILQTHWNEIRKDAAGNLVMYVETGTERHLTKFKEGSVVLQNLGEARQEILSKQTDPGRIHALMQPVAFSRAEVQGMIKVAKRFGGLREFAEALNLWEMADGHIEQLDMLAGQLERQQAPFLKSGMGEDPIRQVETIDAQITGLQYDLASVLTQGSQRLRNIIFWSAVGAGMILFLIGGVMSWRFLRSIHQWEHTIQQNARKINRQLEERTVLLEEVHHRVKHNLAFISGLLFLNEEETENENARQHLKEAQSQIKSIAEIHEIFYDTENFMGLSIQQYASQILHRIFNTFEPGGKPIDFSVEGEDKVLAINEAVPVGLILNELAINTYRHAFADGESGEVTLQVESSNGKIRMTYRDNGRGLPPEFDLEEMTQDSLGMRLIHTFLQQLEADYECYPGTEGFRMEFTFSA